MKQNKLRESQGYIISTYCTHARQLRIRQVANNPYSKRHRIIISSSIISCTRYVHSILVSGCIGVDTSAVQREYPCMYMDAGIINHQAQYIVVYQYY